ncbi:MAG TPA: hypothetical protein DCF33_01015 [Saprospirales bacterium]|nr:hypothetical protein [Saprospirales bacterium]
MLPESFSLYAAIQFHWNSNLIGSHFIRFIGKLFTPNFSRKIGTFAAHLTTPNRYETALLAQ